MFEQILTPWQRARRALRQFLDLSHCRVLTVRQQIGWALLVAAIGAAAALIVRAEFTRPQRERVQILQPVIERVATDYSVYRIPFAYDGREVSWCHIVIYGGDRTWTVKC